MQTMTLRHGLLICMVVALTACTVRPPVSSEEKMVDSISTTQGPVSGPPAAPFCLHVRYANTFWAAYSTNQAEAWVTAGKCADKGTEARPVPHLRLTWHNDWYDKRESRSCPSTDRCVNSERNVLEGHNIHCVAASAQDGDQTAFVTTDLVQCH